MSSPKDCCNNHCTNIIFVSREKLHMMLQCGKCIDEKENYDNKSTL